MFHSNNHPIYRVCFRYILLAGNQSSPRDNASGGTAWFILKSGVRDGRDATLLLMGQSHRTHAFTTPMKLYIFFKLFVWPYAF